MATAFETKQGDILEQQAFVALREEYGNYFDALSKHPRMLVGQEVPRIDGTQGTERLRDSKDAADWQEGVKTLLANEAASRVETQREEMREVFTTVHSSIELFQKNPDLIPGTKGFNRELADAFAEAVGDYQLKSNGKLIGYSVPVQPIIKALRSSLAKAKPAAAPAAAQAQPSPQQQRAAEQPRTPTGQWDGPQAGVRSQAGSTTGGEDDVAAGVLGAFFRQNGITI